MMSRPHLLLSPALIVGLAWCPGCGSAPTVPEVVVLDRSEYDFGERRQGEELSHTFVLKNHAEVSIEITRAVSSCGCVVVGHDGSAPETTIPPGGTLEVPLRLRAGGTEDSVSGRVIVYYRLATESPSDPPSGFVTLKVRAAVLPDFRISPAPLDFGDVDGLLTQRATRALRITPEGGADVQLKNARCTSEFFTARVLPRSSVGSQYEVEVVLDVSRLQESQPLRGSVILSTSSTRLPQAVVGVYGRYLAPVSTEPATVVVGSEHSGEATAELRVLTSRTSAIRCVCPTSDAIRAKFDGARESCEHRVRLSIAAPSRAAHDVVTATAEALKIEVELPSGSGRLRSLTVPVHRFLAKGE